MDFEIITAEEADAIFDENARRLLGISGEEFARREDAGEYEGDGRSVVVQVSMLRTFKEYQP